MILSGETFYIARYHPWFSRPLDTFKNQCA